MCWCPLNVSSVSRTDCSALDYVMLVMRVAELLLLTVITVLLIRARGEKHLFRRINTNYELRTYILLCALFSRQTEITVSGAEKL